jgi:uncharacterized protein YkwD
MNRVRSSSGLAQLRIDWNLQRAARAHSRDMIRRDYFSHGSFASRLQQYGVTGPRIGENLAWGSGTSAGARSMVRMWLASPSHRANLLRPGFRRVGVGAVVGEFRGVTARVATTDFAGT